MAQIEQRIFRLSADSAIFIDDMLNYVFSRNNILRLRIFPLQNRAIHRARARYHFNPEIGEVVHALLQEFLNTADDVISYSRRLRPPNVHLTTRVGTILRFHQVSLLTTADFVRDPGMWASNLLHYLVCVTSLSIYFEQRTDVVTAFDVFGAASAVLNRAMYGRSRQKVESLRQYARFVLHRLPPTQVIVFDIP